MKPTRKHYNSTFIWNLPGDRPAFYERCQNARKLGNWFSADLLLRYMNCVFFLHTKYCPRMDKCREIKTKTFRETCLWIYQICATVSRERYFNLYCYYWFVHWISLEVHVLFHGLAWNIIHCKCVVAFRGKTLALIFTRFSLNILRWK